MRILSPLALGALMTCTAFGQTLVKDINPGIGTNPSSTFTTNAFFSLGGGVMLYAASEGVNGTELWRTDGSAAGTFLVKDINPGSSSSSPNNFRLVGTKILFTALTATNGTEVWVTDGTAAGTNLVFDVYPGTSSGVSTSAYQFAVAGGKLFFNGSDGLSGQELWATDGTAAGTAIVKDINTTTATASSLPYPMYAWGGKVYAQASDGLSGYELWVSDGTAAGTTQVKDIYAGASGSSPVGFCDLGSKLLFFASDGAAGVEPWVTDGTPTGTNLVLNINGTSTSSNTVGISTVLPVMGGKAYFAANDGLTGSELWSSDGTAAGTVLVKDIYGGATASSPTLTAIGSWAIVGSNLFFRATDATTGTELWRTDGTNAGTVQVIDFATGSTSSTMSGLTAYLGTLLFAATDTTTGSELWKSDGTVAGTVQVKDILAGGIGSFPAAFAVALPFCYFSATDGVVGTELWRTDATTAGTLLVKDAATPQPSGGMTGTSMVAFNGKAYFAANDGVNGAELWVSDGTTAGTVLLKDINPGSASSSPANLTVALGKLWFTATDATNGTELWSSDGTAAGTNLFTDLNPGSVSSSPGILTLVGSKLFFAATTATTGNELCVTDGTLAGTQLIDIVAGSTGSTPNNLTAVGSQVMFSGTTAAAGREPYKSDGTVAGTGIIVDLYAGASSGMATSTNNPTASMNGFMYFAGNNGSTGTELFRTDGTAAGTVLVYEWQAGTLGTLPYPMTVMNGALYIEASDGIAGYEMWKSDGVPAGSTTLLKDIYPGNVDSLLFSPRVAINGTLFFKATDGVSGNELWKTDGTPAGTVQVKDIFAGSGAGVLGSFGSFFQLGVGTKLLISATNGTNGTELWTSNGTSAGTVQTFDLNPGASPGVGTLPVFAIVGNDLLFAGNAGTTGTELYSVPLSTLGVAEAETFGANCKSSGNPTIGTSGGAPYVGNAGFNVTLSQASGSVPCALFLNSSRGDTPIGSCTIYPSLVPTINLSSATDAVGSASLNLPIPPAPWNIGVQLYFQWVAIDIGGPIFGVAQSSNGLRIRIGGS